MKATKKPAVSLKKKPSKGAAEAEAEASEVVDEEEATETTQTEEVEEADEEEEAEEAEAAPAVKVAEVKLPPKPPVAEVAVVPAHQKDWVRFTCIREVSPAPTVGNFSLGRELGISKLAQGATYRLPMHVALHLVDSKVGMVLADQA